LEAKVIDEYTIEIGLVAPVYYCLPVSQFGCLSAARGVHKVTSADTEGIEWARSHHIGTGPYVQGDCTPGDRCTMHALDTHWRQVGNVASITGIQVPEATTQIAMLKNGAIDMTELDYKLLPDVVADGFRFLETMPGGFVGQSILFPGNLWEHSHARTAEPLAPWDGPTLEMDYPWIGNPWGHQGGTCTNGDGLGHDLCGNAPYTDADNPAGMDDMEQARLVRLALSTSIDRGSINDVLLNGIGTPIYSEYMGPEYPGWDAARTTGCWDWVGNTITCSGTAQDVPWKIADGDLDVAGALLTTAGYPLVDGNRQGFEKLTLQAYSAEAGPVGLEVADTVMSDWARLGIEIDGLVEDYGGVISPRMRQRVQFLPVLKNGDVHSNVYPLDWPLPTVDTSSSRPGWGVGFESQAGAKWLFEILGEKDASVRSEKHLTWVDYSMFWLQYAGVFQVPKGIVVNDRIKSWDGYQQHYSNVSGNPEFIELK
jgi:ABC-type transport system substrate-binding protein